VLLGLNAIAERPVRSGSAPKSSVYTDW